MSALTSTTFSRRAPLAILGVVALIAGLVVNTASAGPANAAERDTRAAKKSFAYFATIAKSVTVPTGDRRAKTVGDLTIMTGPVSDTYGGGRSGTFTMTSQIAVPGRSTQVRDTQVTVKIPGGTVTAQALNDFPKSGAPTSLNIMPVVGGTGAYATARGTLLVQPVGNTKTVRLAYDIFINPMKQTRKVQVGQVATTTFDSDRRDGRGAVSITSATSNQAQWLSVGTTIGGKSANRQVLQEVRLDLSDGSLSLRSIANVKSGRMTTTRYAVLGGTGAYAGIRGEAVAKPRGQNRLSIILKMNPKSGKIQRTRWVNLDQRTFRANLTGGQLESSSGTMATRVDGKTKLGNSGASTMTYTSGDEVIARIVTKEMNFTSGTIVASGLVPGDEVNAVVPVIGGTSNFGGVGGTLTTTPVNTKAVKMSAAFWR